MTVVVIGDNTGDDFSGTDETDIRSTSQTSNFGTNATFQTTKYSAGNDANGLIKFPGLLEISSPVIVSSAVLTLYWTAGNTGHTVTAKRLLPAWTEGGATWNKYDGTNDWPGSGGGLTDDQDRSSTVAGTIATVATAANNFSDDAFSADVEGMINGTYNNYGWHLERTDSEDDTQYINWAASEGTDGQRPYLTVTYTASGGGTNPKGPLSNPFSGPFGGPI